MSKLKIAINGFGRLGRSIARVITNRDDVELVGINDASEWEILSYLLENDSTHGHFPKSVSYENNQLFIDSKPVKTFSYSNPNDLDFTICDADVVIESSGKFLTQEEVKHHIKKGIKKVVFSAPTNDETPTFVMGVNHHLYNGQNIISNASCTTNCLAPICQIIHENFGIQAGTLSTIHSYTNDQNLLDSAHKSDKRRSRAAAVNIIPTSTGAAKSIYKILPDLKGKLHGHSIRVPVIDVSMVDLNLELKEPICADIINDTLINASKNRYAGILGIDEKYGVSTDFLNDPRSSIVAKDLTFSIGKMVKIMAWYDNEWGYSNRIVDLCVFVSKQSGIN
ncbi:type I glyceraldehyde-3-phosphate dehydrogenase [Helicobacter cappadocius]|uniref:Glyceraldehyde-3-phosphate dehydrogenase n=1 Tax=Helicobacter cappadocius TaxID=3063998 RepID=A0AA90TE77_9HELI|nr:MULTISPECIES: type I glyceraldehyde-3-phosphate dehydrogenase [unclassified Helicobacter]MDO7252458.1 type I glyceraldehyde-3-phosphate dehydrogenase [Helicobacter sp. faydin-H75]MDP2538325.1 type I glyceraldehyde-3-phosphate dehydrogenase [Helicobacter sp. faydin-H76]